MKKKLTRKNRVEPKASRPHMPGYGIEPAGRGGGPLPWSWAVERLSGSHNYWLATTRPDGSPHAMAVWGLWTENQFFFSTGPRSRKARNLSSNPRCVVFPEGAREAVIVEGVARRIKGRALYRRIAALYARKYGEVFEPKTMPLYSVRPHTAFAFVEDPKKFTGSATRWRF